MVVPVGKKVRMLTPAADVPAEALLTNAYDALRQQYDPRWGGFGQAPKFPQAMTHDFLLRAHARRPSGRTDDPSGVPGRRGGGSFPPVLALHHADHLVLVRRQAVPVRDVGRGHRPGFDELGASLGAYRSLARRRASQWYPHKRRISAARA